MRKIVDYTIIADPTSHGLAAIVKIWLKAGWELYGTPYANDKSDYQALVKYEKVEENRRNHPL